MSGTVVPRAGLGKPARSPAVYTGDMPAADVPLIMYGTAWKEESTAACVQTALAAGFRAIDTANQRKHYDEAGVGAALASSSIPRAELFLQSKFTYQRGQDHRLPYDPRAPLATQVAQSVASSLAHLGVTYLDSLVLHGPAEAAGITDDDRQVWAAMEAEVDAGRVRLLGVSNVSAAQYVQLADDARVAPRVVQNRCYASRGWDRATREACNARGAVYQGFSLLTANRDVWHGATVGRIAQRLGGTPAQVIFAFARAVGMLPLTGSRDPAHLAEDLAALDLPLTADDVAAISATTA
jgi:diketogulonate reductase-like aldo/keto reductase